MRKKYMLLSALSLLARKIGEKSVSSVCSWSLCQPKVPKCLLKGADDNKKN